MGELPNRKQGWDLVEYDGSGTLERFIYEHPRHGTQVVLRSQHGTVRLVPDRNPRPEPQNTHQRDVWREP